MPPRNAVPELSRSSLAPRPLLVLGVACPGAAWSGVTALSVVDAWRILRLKLCCVKLYPPPDGYTKQACLMAG